MYANHPLSSLRHIKIINHSELTLSIHHSPYSGSSFGRLEKSVERGQTVDLELFNEIENANGLLAFSTNDKYLFSLIIKDKVVNVHGCKSKQVFFHPEDYLCTLKKDQTGTQIELKIHKGKRKI